ncbi:flagellar protein FlaG [Clostridium beijerinckii]|uniref:flagellar protein FlaG n=1 Tax=Clostridium beijerinckii TaxID=1520 RepID=UPI0003D39AEF|nr:flagellar protein FlaG [Clostridium beijerinckii]ALB44520.1 flagellar protein FlaG [Clostridium beijerinckii NRRL B-598]
MDVNDIGQNAINLNAYTSNSSVSQYTQNGSDVLIPQVQGVEEQSSDNNSKNQEYNKKDLDNALKKINSFLQDEHTHTEYSVHKDFGTIMVKVIDDDTKEVILEIPPQKILDMVASMCRQVGLFDKKV